jgi:MerR family transcriptional regulator, light-induced transcriptional regulator
MDVFRDEMMADNSVYLSTAQVSQALGVGVSTVKRWVDEGVLPAHRTAGGHRKLLLADVIRLTRERKLPQVELTKLLLPKRPQDVSPNQFRNRMIQAVRIPDLDMIPTILRGAYESGLTIETLADEIICPAMKLVGDEWAMGKIDVTHEHQVTQTFVATLYELRSILRRNAETDRPVALGGSPENDHTILGTLLAKLTLLDSGWNALNLGPHTPVGAFKSAIDTYSPKLLWMSVSYVADTDQFIRDFQELYQYAKEREIPVAVGGRGLEESIRTRIHYTSYGDGLTQLAAFAQTLHPFSKKVSSKVGRPLGTRRKNMENN